MCGRRAFVNQFATLAFYQCEGVTSVAPVWLVPEPVRKSPALTGEAFSPPGLEGADQDPGAGSAPEVMP